MARMQEFPILRARNGEPLVEQYRIGKAVVSWNPDDNRFYVDDDNLDIPLGRFDATKMRGWGNAIQRAKEYKRGGNDE